MSFWCLFVRRSNENLVGTKEWINLNDFKSGTTKINDEILDVVCYVQQSTRHLHHPMFFAVDTCIATSRVHISRPLTHTCRRHSVSKFNTINQNHFRFVFVTPHLNEGIVVVSSSYIHQSARDRNAFLYDGSYNNKSRSL